MQVPPGPGPAKYDRVFVQQLGPSGADNVLVLVPGTNGGAGSITPVARDIVRRAPRTQVWIVDRREQAFEDTSVFASGDPQRAQDYYLGFQYKRVAGEDAKFVAEWGLKLQLADLRSVIRRARAGGRRVILGGHSAGASTAVAYAAWDFGGRPGYRDLDGLVLIDGGLLGSFTSPQLAGVRQRLAALQIGDPFLDLLGIGAPWAAGVLSATAGMYARLRPDERTTLLDFPLIPPSLRAPVPVTNEAALGYAFDHSTSPAALSLIQVRAGRLAASGDPRPWQDGEVSPIQRVARLFGRSPTDATEWYFPVRLSLDVDGASGLGRGPVTKLLGLREFHRRSIRLPLYALQTDLTGGRVLRGARRLIASTKIPARRSKLVDASRTNSHLDPLTAAPARSAFLKTVIPFLRRR
jgi:pimeloyl-ACP methyl ester carboxylesterase